MCVASRRPHSQAGARRQPVEAIGQPVIGAVMEHDGRREPRPVAYRVGIFLDDIGVDGGLWLGVAVDPDAVEGVAVMAPPPGATFRVFPDRKPCPFPALRLWTAACMA